MMVTTCSCCGGGGSEEDYGDSCWLLGWGGAGGVDEKTEVLWVNTEVEDLTVVCSGGGGDALV